MKRRTILISLILSLVGFGIFFLISSMELQASTTGEILVHLKKALFYGMPALALVFLVLLFSPHAVSVWKKFAKWFLPVATLIFVFYDNPSSGDLFSPYPEQVFKWISILYVVISILIVGWSATKRQG
jgi:hypothetical protein